jgi:hypothetical protein
MELLKNQTANTTGTQPTIEGKGANVLVQVEGTFDGATFGIEGKMGNLSWQTLRDTTGEVVALTEASTIVVGYIKSGFQIRASLTGVGGSTDVTAVAAT